MNQFSRNGARASARSSPDQRWSGGAIVLCAALSVTFLFGGGSRSDIASLLLLRPLSFLFLGYAIWLSNLQPIFRNPLLSLGLTALIVLHIVHLVPLPPGIWTALPYRELLATNLGEANIALGWRPISIVPFATWNSLFSLAAPFACYLLFATLTQRRDRDLVVLVLAGLIAVSATLGILQSISGYDSSLYFYRLTNNGSATGLLANRNHNGFLLACGVPVLGYLVAHYRNRFRARHTLPTILFIGLSYLLVGVLLTGSRGAIIVFALACATLPLFAVRRGRVSRIFNKQSLGIAAAASVLLLIIAILAPGSSLNRIAATGFEDELRLQIWPPIWQAIWQFFPVGSGLGTFVEAYQIAEPDRLLRPSYINHAHNDWLEFLLDGGLPAALIMCAGVATWLWAAARILADRHRHRLPLMGLSITGLLAVASFVDYPLRTPSLASLFALAIACVAAYKLPGSDHGQDDG